MKIKLTVATMALGIFGVAHASDYQFQNVTNKDHIQEAIEIAADMGRGMKFGNTSLTRIQLQQKTKQVSMCIVDQIVGDVLEADLGPDDANELLSAVHNFHFYGERRDRYMEKSDINYVYELEYRCLDYHPNPNLALMYYSHSISTPLAREACWIKEIQAVGLPCLLKFNDEHLAALKKKHGLE